MPRMILSTFGLLRD